MRCFAVGHTGENGAMGMLVLLGILVGVFGLGAMFVAPWVGAPLLGAAVILGVVGLVTGTARAATEDPEPRDVETPHMPGPSTPD